MALKKSQLYSSLWQSCDELRGGMDASQYKDYVLTLLFMKYVSDKAASAAGSLIEVPKGASFADMVALKGDKEIGDKINKIIARLAEANDLKGVIDQADFNDEGRLGSGKEIQDRLSKLVAIFDGLDFRANRAEGDDLLGDAYEYLMRNFATESGKSKGQFYTPAEVSRIMAQVIGIERAGELREPTVYDPTCGSGSLLIKAADEAGTSKLAIYGQEMDVATWALARMNMVLHGHPTAELWRGNTLSAPHFKNKDGRLRTFDFAVANPPFSAKAWSSGLDPAHDEFGRFEFGVPPTKSGDFAFLLHLIASLKSSGKGAIILPHGVLFRGHKEADIRRQLVQRGLIKGIIGLPANLFYGTGIPACIVVIDKEHAHARTGLFMIDASRGFQKDGNKNRLRSQDIHKIVDVFSRQTELPRYSRMVPVAEIASPANDYNLNLPRYLDSSEPEDLHDLDAHLNGGIPLRDIDALDAWWRVFPTMRKALFLDNGREGYREPRVPASELKAVVLGHAEFNAFAARIADVFEGWRTAHEPALRGIAMNDRPRALIHTLSEDLLACFDGLPLVSRYDVYQLLMDYWAEVMQDDVYLVAADGWQDAARPRGIVDDKARNIKETPDLTIGRQKYKMDLVPPTLVVARFFAKEHAAIDDLQAEQEAAARELEAFVEEHSGEEGLLAEAVNDKGKVTKGGVKDRLKAGADELASAAGDAEDDAAERDALERCLALIDAESVAAKAVKEAQAALDEKALACYGKLTEAEIKTLVVEDKWLASLHAAIDGEVQRVTQQLAGRVKELGERYAKPLPALDLDVEASSAKVDEHLKKMGLLWE
jgi:type I restriction enzyme M protein